MNPWIPAGGMALVLATAVVGAAPGLAGVRHDRVVLLAHRGGIDDGIPENTLAAFRHAIARGADGIEIDLRGTRDGQIVVVHDATVDRTTNGRGRVAAKSLVELQALDAGRGERIPTCDEVLRLVAGTDVLLLLDIKQDPALDRQRVARLIEQRDAAGNVVVGVRTLADLRLFQAQNPGLRTLGFVGQIEDIGLFVQAGVDIIRLRSKWIGADPGLIGRVKKLGKPVWVLAGDASRADLERLIALGADGIISDLPDVIHELRAATPAGTAH